MSTSDRMASSFARTVVRLRRGADGTIERFLAGDAAWIRTGLSGETVFDGETLDTLNGLLYRLLTVEELHELESELRLARQRSIGRDLYKALFGSNGGLDVGQWLHIMPELASDPDPRTRAADERFLDLICRLPWAFLTQSDASNAPFLVLDPTEPVSITIDAAPGRGFQEWFDVIKLPPYPRLLMVIPEVQGLSTPTRGEEHRRALVGALGTYYQAGRVPENLQVVRSFEAFDDTVRDQQFDPHIVYFYGHGLADGYGTHFQFEGAGGSEDWRDFDEVRVLIDDVLQRTHFPPVVWINACLGAAAEQDSALRNLAPVSCCVITTRTLAAIDDSRALAEAALPMIVIGGSAPHSALRQALRKRPPTVKCARWATTIIAVQYGVWSALTPEIRVALDRDSIGDFPGRMDRNAPLAAIATALTDRLGKAGLPEPIVWHGGYKQGVEAFEERVAELVHERFPDRTVLLRQVELQPDVRPRTARARENHFRESLFHGLRRSERAPTSGAKVDNARILGLVERLSGARSLVLILHGPFEAKDVGLIHDYLAFWRDLVPEVTPRDKDLRIVLGFGFFEEEASPMQPLPDVLACPLGPVPPRELTDHMMQYRRFYNVSELKIPERANALVDRYGGMFVPIRRELERLARFSDIQDNDGGRGQDE